MANSKHVEIRDAVATVLAAVAGGRVFKNRDFSLAEGVASQVHVNFRRSALTEPVMYANHPRDWSTTIEITVRTRKTGTTEASDAADALWVEVYGLLMADESLGGLADFLMPGDVEVDDAEADTSLCRLDWSITVQHRTANNSISA